jgi:RING-box protein 1
MIKSDEQESQKYKVLKWNAIAQWNFDNISDTCGICKNKITESCINCQANQEKFESNSCKKVVGKCNHSFHCHCIDEWIKKKNLCPLDFSEWMPMRFMD